MAVRRRSRVEAHFVKVAQDGRYVGAVLCVAGPRNRDLEGEVTGFELHGLQQCTVQRHAQGPRMRGPYAVNNPNDVFGV